MLFKKKEQYLFLILEIFNLLIRINIEEAIRIDLEIEFRVIRRDTLISFNTNITRCWKLECGKQ